MSFRIALFTNKYPAKVSTFISRDIFMFLENGFQVDVYTTYPVETKNWRWVPSIYLSEIQNSVNVIYIPPKFSARKWIVLSTEIKQILKESLLFGFPQFIKSLLVILQSFNWDDKKKDSYDAMLSYWGNYAGTYAYLANRLLKTKLPYMFFLHAGTDLYRDQIFLEEKIKYASKVITVCAFNIDFLKGLYPDSFYSFKSRIILYHLGVDLNDISLNINDRESFTLLTIGSLDKIKGFQLVVEALAFLKSEFPDIKLIMIGNGPEKKNIIKLAKTFCILENITFTGHLTFIEVKNFLAKSTLLIHPSTGLGDAVPTVIKEALASGLPVIGSNIVGIPELLDHGKAGMLFSPNDIDELIFCIRKLLRNPSLRKTYSQNGRKFAEEKFDLYTNSKELISQIDFSP